MSYAHYSTLGPDVHYSLNDGKYHPFEHLLDEGVHYRISSFSKEVAYVVHLRDVNGDLMPDRYFEHHKVSNSGDCGTFEDYMRSIKDE